MARAFSRKGQLFVAKLDDAERGVVVGLMEQVLELVAPDLPSGPASDPFDEIVAGLGSLGAGVSVAAEDQVGDDVPDDAAALTDRDPALERLLPSANREDGQAAAEFRRMSEHSIRTAKARNLRSSIDALSGAGGRLELTRAQAQSFVVALTDVRLVIGERLGVRTEEDMAALEAELETMDEDDPVVYAMLVYDFVTWLQETLATALLPTAGRDV